MNPTYGMAGQAGGGGGRGRGRGSGRGGAHSYSHRPSSMPVQNNPQVIGAPVQHFGQPHPNVPSRKPPLQIAENVGFIREMLLNVPRISQAPCTLSAFVIGGIPPDIQVYTADESGNLREFSFSETEKRWKQSNSASFQGRKITALLSANMWLFVGIVYPGEGNQLFGMIKAINLQNTKTFDIPAHTISIKCLEVGIDMLLSGGGDGRIKAWKFSNDTEGWKFVGEFNGDVGAHQGEITNLNTKSPFFLISSSNSGELKAWKLSDGTLVAGTQAHHGSVIGLDFIPESYIVTCGQDYQNFIIKVWSITTNVITQIHEINPSPGRNIALTTIRVIPVNGQQQLYVGKVDGTVLVYHLVNPSQFDRLGFVKGHSRSAPVVSIKYVELANKLCVVTMDGLVNWFAVVERK